jgi:hypothetical protein
MQSHVERFEDVVHDLLGKKPRPARAATPVP